MTQEEIIKQQMSDLTNCITVLVDILGTKSLNPHDIMRINYAEKLIKSCNERIKAIHL